MKFEITNSKGDFKKMLCGILAFILAFACLQPSFTTIAAYWDPNYGNNNGQHMHSSSPVTNGNVVTSSNVGNIVLVKYEGDEYYTVSDCDQFAEGEIVIPETYNDLPVKKIGNLAFANCDNLTSITIPNSVISVGYGAFISCDNLTSITIPDSITSIEEFAFCECYSLTSVYITDIAAWCNIDFLDYESNPLIFADCLYVNGQLPTEVVIPDNATKIPDNTFQNLDGLKSVVIGKGVKCIGEYAFYNCNNLTDITLPEGLTTIEEFAFAKCSSLSSITIPNSVMTIGEEAFSNCSSLSSLKISENLTRIEGATFAGCESLITVIIPDSVTEIGSSAFWGCDSVTSITIPDSVTNIGSSAFSCCRSVASITIPDSVTNIGDGAFSSCGTLTSVTIGDSVNHIGDYAFSWCYNLKDVYISNLASWCRIDFASEESNPLYYAQNLYVNGELVSDLIIPDDVRSIDDYAFSNFYGITSITIPENVTNIGDYAFYGCENLTTITIPESVTSIGADAFGYCVSLTAINVSENNSVYSSVDGVLFNKNKTKLIIYPQNKYVDEYKIPDTVTSIENDAFDDVKFSTLVLGTGMTNIKKGTFAYCADIRTIAIPMEVTSISSGAFGQGYTASDSNSNAGSNRPSGEAAGPNIGDVFYEGTESQWNNISIAIDNSRLTNGRFHYNVDIANLKSHYGKPVKTTQPTCTSAGKNTYVCACGHEIVEQFANALGHDYAEEWTVDYEVTCVSYGMKSRHCSRCDSKTDYIYTPADPSKHVSSDWIFDKNATVNAPGSKHKVCRNCNQVTETEVIPQLKPATPKLTKITNTASGVQVTWGKVSGADSYTVYRKTYDAKTKKWGGWSKIATVKGNATVTFTDETAKSGTYYLYTVRATNEGGTGGYNTSGIKTYFISTPKLTSTANTNSAITVKWGKVTGANGYVVYRKTGNNGWTKIATVKGNGIVSYTDKTAKSGVTYKYTVRAYYGSYLSTYNANGLAVRRLTTPSLKSVTSAKSGITFKWNKVTGATGYTVYRKTGNGGWQKLATVKGTSKVSYFDKTAKKGVTYKYTVRAYYGTSTSAYNTKGLAIKDKY